MSTGSSSGYKKQLRLYNKYIKPKETDHPEKSQGHSSMRVDLKSYGYLERDADLCNVILSQEDRKLGHKVLC